jgi:hypothetical protein
VEFRKVFAASSALIVVYGMKVNLTWPVIEFVKPRIDWPYGRERAMIRT